jgi:hypothetical protein
LFSEAGSDVIERECDVRDVVAVAIDVLSFLNGRVKAFAPCFTDFFKEAALPENVEDFVEDVSVGFAMIAQAGMKTHLRQRRPIYNPSDPILNLLIFFKVGAA